MHACNQRFRTAFCVFALATCLVGCQSIQKDKDEGEKSWKPALPDSVAEKIPWTDAARNRPRAPAKLVAMWSDTVKRQAGKQPERGFGGRIVFYDGEEEQVCVDGQLVVYAFDETDRDPENVVPDRKFVFPAETLEAHHSDSELGPSYSFWLPWDAVGGEQTQISLITRFETTNGPLIVGEQTKHILPGNQPLSRQVITHGQRTAPSTTMGMDMQGGREAPVHGMQAVLGTMSPPATGTMNPTGGAMPVGAVQQASFHAASAAPAQTAPIPNARRLQTTTIALPAQYGQQRPMVVGSSRSRRLRSSSTTGAGLTIAQQPGAERRGVGDGAYGDGPAAMPTSTHQPQNSFQRAPAGSAPLNSSMALPTHPPTMAPQSVGFPRQ